MNIIRESHTSVGEHLYPRRDCGRSCTYHAGLRCAHTPRQGEYGGFADSYQLEDFEDHFGLTLRGTYDLLAAGDDIPTDQNIADSLPELTSNREAGYYYLEANSDGDELMTFLQEGWVDIVPPLVTISIDGSEPVNALTREGVTIFSSFRTLTYVYGRDSNDVIVASEASNEGDDSSLSFYLGGGDDKIVVQLGQHVRVSKAFDWDEPFGTDHITLTANAEDVAAAQTEPNSGFYSIDKTDTMSVELDPATEGRLVKVVYTYSDLGGAVDPDTHGNTIASICFPGDASIADVRPPTTLRRGSGSKGTYR